MVNSQPHQHAGHATSQFQPPIGHFSLEPLAPTQSMPSFPPSSQPQIPNSWSVISPRIHNYPPHLDLKWYFSESIRHSARDLHGRVYMPSTSTPDPDRFDAMFRPIITTSIDWAEPFGPYLAIRMWRWTGWFAPEKQGLVVEKFMGRFGLRDQKTKEPTTHALVLHKLLTGLPRLRMGMIKLPPNGTAKLLVPTAISSVYHTELLLDGDGIEIVPSAVYEMNLNFLTSGGRIRDPASPMILLDLPANTTPISIADIPRRDAYDPHTLPIPIADPLPAMSSSDMPDLPTYYPKPNQSLPALCRSRVSSSETILATPGGGDIHLRTEMNEDRVYRIEGRTSPFTRLGLPRP